MLGKKTALTLLTEKSYLFKKNGLETTEFSLEPPAIDQEERGSAREKEKNRPAAGCKTVECEYYQRLCWSYWDTRLTSLTLPFTLLNWE